VIDVYKILFESLTLRQAAKWLLIHEKRRHQQDIAAINQDLKTLVDVELPDDLLSIAGRTRFELKGE
jgi:hypothetical protein